MAELALVPHLEDGWQLLPVVASGLAFSGIGWHLAAAGRSSARALALALALLAAVGAAGLWLHLEANLEFEREVARDAAGFSLLWRALRGTAPPSLAPAALIEFALLGALALWRDPAFASTQNSGRSS